MSFLTQRRKMLAEAEKLGINANGRQAGKSTGEALRALGMAMTNPGLEVRFDDHFGTQKANKNQYDLARRIVNRLELEGFIFHTVKLTVTYALEDLCQTHMKV